MRASGTGSRGDDVAENLLVGELVYRWDLDRLSTLVVERIEGAGGALVCRRADGSERILAARECERAPGDAMRAWSMRLRQRGIALLLEASVLDKRAALLDAHEA
jgi:hypothetical protein